MTTDPKDPARLFSNRTLWLDPSTMEQARDNFWQAYMAYRRQQPAVEWREYTSPAEGNLTITRHAMSEDEAHAIWDIAFAAAIAAISYVMEGNLGPR